jgi:ACS family hexuronate transporter-like MFS transporter
LIKTILLAGSIGGGWLPMYFIKGGWPVFSARKTAMLVYIISVIAIFLLIYLIVIICGW